MLNWKTINSSINVSFDLNFRTHPLGKPSFIKKKTNKSSSHRFSLGKRAFLLMFKSFQKFNRVNNCLTQNGSKLMAYQWSDNKVETSLEVIGENERHVIAELSLHSTVSGFRFLIAGPVTERHFTFSTRREEEETKWRMKQSEGFSHLKEGL